MLITWSGVQSAKLQGLHVEIHSNSVLGKGNRLFVLNDNVTDHSTPTSLTLAFPNIRAFRENSTLG